MPHFVVVTENTVHITIILF